MKRYLIIALLGILALPPLTAQPQRMGGGLSFSTKFRFNYGDTGNPGLNLKTWIQLDKKNAMHLVPSVTVFNPGQRYQTSHRTYNYLFHGDIDFHFRVFHEKTIKVIAIGGLNYSHVISRNEIYVTPPIMPVDSALYGFGPALGASLEMRMNAHWDFVITGKYTFPGFSFGDIPSSGLLNAPLSSPIIQVHGVYYFRSRGKGYSRY